MPHGAKERARILAILEAHREEMPGLYARLVNLINSGLDLPTAAKLSKGNRPLGFHWPTKPKRHKRP
jgi:hypothetical protein